MQSKTGFPSSHQLKVIRRPYAPPEIGGALYCQRMLAFLLLLTVRLASYRLSSWAYTFVIVPSGV